MEDLYRETIVDAGHRTQDYGAAFGFKRVGVHHVVLPPLSRSSMPHAESLEEEFVYVVSGHPHVWIDGHVYLAHPSCAAGFPPGTGVAHTFINNTEEPVELVVLGERTKKENLCAFPVNPEMKMESPIWWPDAPGRPLGPHDGTVHPVSSREIGGEWPACLIDAARLPLTGGFTYPGDSETFVDFTRLGSRLGLTKVAVSYEVLAPGHRTSFPHAHEKEEEFAFILSGTAHVWLHGFAHVATAGCGIGFAPGTGLAHTIINDGAEPLRFLMIGQTDDALGFERIAYPKHPFRDIQMQREGCLWDADRPRRPMGPHPGRPRLGLPDHLALSLVDADEAGVFEIFQASPIYFQRVDGVEPSTASARLAMTDGPKNRGPDYLKEFLFVRFEDRAVGVADLHIQHPEKGMAYLGLLLLRQDRLGQGLGLRSYRLIENYLRRAHQIKRLRLGVSNDNDVGGFWRRCGFAENGKTYAWQGENKTTTVVEFEKAL